MATKAQYLATLASRAVWMSAPKALDLDPAITNGEITGYDVRLLVALPNGTYAIKTQGFYVLDEGGAGETVYPINAEAENNPPSAFRAQLDAYLATRISATIIKIVVDQANAEQEFALVTAYTLNAESQIETKRYFIAKDAQGAAYIREFVG